MAVDVYINFNGNCREAIEFYATIFGMESPQIMTFGDAPPSPEFPITEDLKKLIMNASLVINGSTVMFSDLPPGMPFIAGNNISLVLNNGNMDELKFLFDKLKEGGTVTMELQETFWSKYYGFVIDKFGIGWQLNFKSGEIA
ncbi:MAG: glyoxalase/bleomycin resistance/extradiol dioxygenase family protein [Clostridiaceae bacterium]|nr:glyoxalase/bleomycin resistance/extradiol dioxygenase family protein [Clostridiaceae bacterium]